MTAEEVPTNFEEFDVDDAETTLREGDEAAVLDLAKQHLDNETFEHFMGYSYAEKTMNLVQFAARHLKHETLSALLAYLKQLIGPHLFDKETRASRDKFDKDVLCIACKYRNDEVIWHLLNTCVLDVNYYPFDGKGALYYLISRKRLKIIHAVLSLMKTEEYSKDDLDYFGRDMREMRKVFGTPELTSKKWVDILTRDYRSFKGGRKGRTAKMLAPVYREKCDYSNNRRRQILRQIAFQLFCRWKFHLGIWALKDVQVLCFMPKPTKENPTPRPSLYITTCPIDTVTRVKDDFKRNRLRAMLTRVYYSKDIECMGRSKRYARKLEQRIWKGIDLTRSTKEGKLIMEILRADHRKNLHINKQNNEVMISFFKTAENCCFLLMGSQGYNEKYDHAVDILCEAKIALSATTKATTAIFGKRRPCLVTCAKMRHAQIDYFHKRPSFIWMRMYEQIESYDVREEALELLFTKPLYVTMGRGMDKDGRVDTSTELYNIDTASDSD